MVLELNIEHLDELLIQEMCNEVVNLSRVAILSTFFLEDAHPEILFLQIDENYLVQVTRENMHVDR